MRGEFFNISPSSMLDTRGLTGMQADFLEGEFVNRIMPLQKELNAIEERRSQRAYNDLRLQEQTFAFEQAQEESKSKREILTRLPTLLQDLGAVDEFAEFDPESAAKTLLQIQRENADAYVSNPAFRTIFDATSSRLNTTVNARKAKDDGELEYNARLYSHADPEVSALGESRMASNGLTEREQQVLGDGKIIKGADERARTTAQQVAAVKAWQEDLLSDFERDLRRLDGVKSIELKGPLSFDDPAGASGPTMGLSLEDEQMLRAYAVKYKIANPDADPFRLREQIYEGLTKMKQQLRSGPAESNIPGSMRGPVAK